MSELKFNVSVFGRANPLGFGAVSYLIILAVDSWFHGPWLVLCDS